MRYVTGLARGTEAGLARPGAVRRYDLSVTQIETGPGLKPRCANSRDNFALTKLFRMFSYRDGFELPVPVSRTRALYIATTEHPSCSASTVALVVRRSDTEVQSIRCRVRRGKVLFLDRARFLSSRSAADGILRRQR